MYIPSPTSSSRPYNKEQKSWPPSINSSIELVLLATKLRADTPGWPRQNDGNSAPQALQIHASLLPDSDGRALPLPLI